MNDICYYDKNMRQVKGSIISKARKFVKEGCVERTEDPHIYRVKPIKGYNKTTYKITIISDDIYDCNCQYANPQWLKEDDVQPVCSHKMAVALYKKTREVAQ